MLIEQARQGDMDAAKILVGLLPRRKPVSLPEALPSFPAGDDLSQQARAILEQAAAGQIDRDAAAEMMGLVVASLKVWETHKLAEQVRRLSETLCELEAGRGQRGY